MISLALLRGMKGPVGVEITAGAESAEAKHGAGPAQALLHQMTARPLDHAGGDWQPGGARSVIMEMARTRGQVRCASIDRLLGGGVELSLAITRAAVMGMAGSSSERWHDR